MIVVTAGKTRKTPTMSSAGPMNSHGTRRPCHFRPQHLEDGVHTDVDEPDAADADDEARHDPEDRLGQDRIQPVGGEERFGLIGQAQRVVQADEGVLRPVDVGQEPDAPEDRHHRQHRADRRGQAQRGLAQVR